ncbi:MAG TPA: fructose-bisphosphate aldolase, partial [Porticoccaceae bacterium]|nr:fructose-bisphosphate aldolase [Porticoccaceae bacterium]
MSRTLSLLGEEGSELLNYRCQGIDKSQLHLPGPDFVSDVVACSDRPVQVLRNLQAIFNHGRLSGSGYLSILPVDQGIEHSAG